VAGPPVVMEATHKKLAAPDGRVGPVERDPDGRFGHPVSRRATRRVRMVVLNLENLRTAPLGEPGVM